MRHNNKKKPNLANIYGFHAVSAAWLNEDRSIHELYITSQAQSGFEGTLLEAKRSKLTRPTPTIIDKHKLEKMLPRGAVHQGIAIACTPLEESDIQDFIISASSLDKTKIVILDQVTDPHNVGAIMRSACAFGANGIIMQKKHAPELTGVLAKTACGAVEHIPVAYATNLTRSIETLQSHGFFVIGLDERGQDISEIDTPDKCVIVLGAEGAGIRRLIKDNCDILARLPMSGTMPSINVSNAAAVAFYALSYSNLN